MTPLYVERVAEALARKGGDFDESQSGIQATMENVQDALTAFEGMSRADVERRIAGIERPGARPTVEQDTLRLIARFGGGWGDHREAREWAAAALAGVTTFAVDGSQIFPSGDMSIPVGLVQVGWFENRHDSAGSYVKDVQVEVLTPLELTESFDAGYAEREIEWRRFYSEVARTLAFMDAHRGKPALAFFDGSLILSFVNTMREQRQREYVEIVQRMIAFSEETGVPLVGFVDSSQAADMTTLLGHATGYSGQRMGDAAALRSRMQWGDRSRLFVCSRDDAVIDNRYYEQVLFTYLKTTRDHPPARVEIPAWIFQRGLHEWVLDVVRAECVVGVGYPYPLETADAVAVLSFQDRERFYGMFQEFAARRGISVHFSRKSISKRGRRV
jgi:hypothetical protein